MRILMTTDTVGGVWTYANELTRELLAAGCAVALVSFGRFPTPSQLDWVAQQSTRYGNKFRFNASDLPLEWMQQNGQIMSDAEPLLLRIASEFRADLLLTSQYCFGALATAMPRIVVAHSDVLSWAKACRNQPMPPSAWLDTYRGLVSEGLRYADAVVAPTRWMLDALAENFALPKDARVIPNGRTVEPPPIAQERRPQAISAGRLWDEAKNLQLLAAVDSPIPILVAGQLEHDGAAFFDSAGQSILLGPLDEHEMLALMTQSSIYICTSNYEPFGLAPLEAALCGCGVLAHDIPSLREVWGDGALYFHDARSLSGLLSILADDPRALGHARACARARALRFSARRMAEGYLDLFHGTLLPVLTEYNVA